MRESDTYMAIIDEGREREARRLIHLLAEEHLGQADEQTVTHLEDITDLACLERMIKRAGKATTWQDLLATP